MSKTVYEFNFDYAKCKNKYANYNKKAKKILKNEVVKDTDKFVPYKNGIVSKSAINSIMTILFIKVHMPVFFTLGMLWSVFVQIDHGLKKEKLRSLPILKEH